MTLIVLMFNPVTTSSSDYNSYCLIGYNEISSSGSGKDPNCCTLDFSKISSITFKYYSCYFNNMNPLSNRCQFILFDSYGNNIGVNFDSNENAQTIDLSSRRYFDPTKKCAIGLNLDYVRYLASKFEIISFTTTDGKVHTKDNLNY